MTIEYHRELAVYIAKQVTDTLAYGYTEDQRSLLFDRITDSLMDESIGTLISLLRRDR